VQGCFCNDPFPTHSRLVQILAALAEARVGSAPLLIIAHSLGGVIAKRLLTLAEERSFADLCLSRRCQGVVFLGTPHNGSAAIAIPTFLPLTLAGGLGKVRPR
jgi:pimeloyl-ACP methyl ester carboxylesterase